MRGRTWLVIGVPWAPVRRVRFGGYKVLLDVEQHENSGDNDHIQKQADAPSGSPRTPLPRRGGAGELASPRHGLRV
jgi:hypothetical protein